MTTTKEAEPRPSLSVAERRELGRRARQVVPRSALGEWAPAAERDPLSLLAEQELTRVPELVPIRHQRMAVSPFTFFRGAAKVFAADLAGAPRTDLKVQLCGDAHLTNFGGFASPERRLVFDLNDFDETLPGPFEWDLKRLAASFEVAARGNGLDEADRPALQRTLATTYASAMQQFSSMSHLDIWYAHLSLDQFGEYWDTSLSDAMRSRVERTVHKAQGKDRLKALRKLTTVRDGEPRFLSDPPLLEPVTELPSHPEHDKVVEIVATAFQNYRRTLQADRRVLLERYRFVDLARKVVGVGSVGTRCWVALLMGKDDDDPLFLQVKEAEASVLEPHLRPSGFAQHGQRVVEGQRLMQATSDIFLGWERLHGVDGRDHDYYFRQLWDWKASADVDGMDPALLARYAQMCGYTLARAHARSGDAVALSAYLGGGKALGEAMVRFASVYADQNERDHEAFVAHVASPERSP
ncbi:DUF2252 domain-containing protein [Rhabdothermincola salaria]|uniref:DUF2252 domain-containing protein n=1 Tax=Rhabdothermincola salaria TaxID=2903142 RepID=UPI001E383913|nr:DUF2252 domain-containing protein [Rhabdothermincola salaria]MCD9624042.1 DUF2252 domain-containing protein [Rhabdothermincola salaria]